MTKRDAFILFLYLFLGFASEGGAAVEALLFWNSTTVVMILQVPFLVAMVMAFLTAQRAHRRVMSREQGLFCSQCNYDMRATPDRCPECGGAGTGVRVASASAGHTMDGIVFRVFGLAVVAFVAAAMIMMHVLVAAMPAGGGGH